MPTPDDRNSSSEDSPPPWDGDLPSPDRDIDSAEETLIGDIPLEINDPSTPTITDFEVIGDPLVAPPLAESREAEGIDAISESDASPPLSEIVDPVVSLDFADTVTMESDRDAGPFDSTDGEHVESDAPPQEEGSFVLGEADAISRESALSESSSDGGGSLSGLFGDRGTEPAVTTPQPAPASDKQFLWIVFLATYAITTTAALLYLYFKIRSYGSGSLESLPDVKPLRNGEVRIYRMDSPLPAGHSLEIGDSARFGNILIEPLRITHGPLEFQYFSENLSQVRPPTADVLKLWVRITNQSQDQTLAPLDSRLLFPREVSASGDLIANNFVISDDNPRMPVFLFDLPLKSSWALHGVAADQPLAPGESIETFLPTTEEGWKELQGDIVWRFHIRKGLSASGNGVTTLVEVQANADDIASDAADSEV
jgi:hypothetical protein